MNTINIKNYGVKEYEDKDIITFKDGIPGFDNLKQFILFNIEESNYCILQSIEDANVGFILISPFDVMKDYEFEIDEEVEKELGVHDISDISVLNTVTLNNDINKITTNLRAPIVINFKEKKGKQIVLNNDSYLIKYPLFKEGE